MNKEPGDAYESEFLLPRGTRFKVTKTQDLTFAEYRKQYGAAKDAYIRIDKDQVIQLIEVTAIP